MGDLEKRLCFQSNSHGLPRIHIALDDDAVYRRPYLGTLLIELRLGQGGLLLLNDRLGIG